MKFSNRETQMIQATSELVGRTGATDMQLRYHDDVQPVIWIGVALYERGTHMVDGSITDRTAFQVAAGPSPVEALWQLVTVLVNGGECAHCGKVTAIERDFTAQHDDDRCWYKFDPEVVTFRRSCEGIHEHEQCPPECEHRT